MCPILHLLLLVPLWYEAHFNVLFHLPAAHPPDLNAVIYSSVLYGFVQNTPNMHTFK